MPLIDTDTGRRYEPMALGTDGQLVIFTELNPLGIKKILLINKSIGKEYVERVQTKEVIADE